MPNRSEEKKAGQAKSESGPAEDNINTQSETGADALERLRAENSMNAQLLYHEQLLRKKQEDALIKINRELADKVAKLERASEDSHASRRAALNLMEDAIAAKEALRESEEKYRELFERIDEGFCIIEMIFDGTTPVDYRFVEVNPTFGLHTGISDAKGRLMRDIAPAHEQHWFDYYGQVALTGRPNRFEAHAKELGDRWYDVNAFRVGASEQHRVAVIFSDVTKRKHHEQQLLEFNNRLEREVADRTRELRRNYALVQTIYDTTLIGMSVVVPVRNIEGGIIDFRIIAANKKIVRSSGRDSMTGLLYSELFPGVENTELFDLMVNTIETGEAGQIEHRYTYEGKDTWYSTMFVKGEDLLVSTDIDITERKRLEDKRLRALLLLQQSEDLAGIGSWDYDLQTGTFSWSDGMYRMFKLEKGQEVSPGIYLGYAIAECRETAKRITDHIEQGDSGFEDSLTINVDGTIKVLKLKATVIKNEQGQPVRVLGVDIDVTSAQAAEERLRKIEVEQQLEIFRVTLRIQEDERRRISESLHNGLGQILYGVKLSISELSIRAANKDPEGFELSRRYTNTLLSEAIRDTRRISHELMPATLDEFGLKAAIEDVCRQIQGAVKFTSSIELSGAELEKYMQLAVFRTVQELMLNVVKHASATMARTEISYDGHHIVIEVSDNGVGIAPDKQGKDGIGLASVRSKIDLLNGKMTIHSVPGEGTSVIIRLPYTGSKINMQP